MMMHEWVHLKGAQKSREVVAAAMTDVRGGGDCAGWQHERGYYP